MLSPIEAKEIETSRAFLGQQKENSTVRFDDKKFRFLCRKVVARPLPRRQMNHKKKKIRKGQLIGNYLKVGQKQFTQHAALQRFNEETTMVDPLTIILKYLEIVCTNLSNKGSQGKNRVMILLG